MSSRRNRPLGVSVLAVLWLLSAVLLVILASEMWHGRLGGGSLPEWFSVGLIQRAPYVALLALGCGIIAFGLWEMQNWARLITIGLSGLGFIRTGFVLLMHTVFAEAVPRRGSSMLVWFLVVNMAVNGLIVWYLMSDDVSKAFREAW